MEIYNQKLDLEEAVELEKLVTLMAKDMAETVFLFQSQVHLLIMVEVEELVEILEEEVQHLDQEDLAEVEMVHLEVEDLVELVQVTLVVEEVVENFLVHHFQERVVLV